MNIYRVACCIKIIAAARGYKDKIFAIIIINDKKTMLYILVYICINIYLFMINNFFIKLIIIDLTKINIKRMASEIPTNWLIIIIFHLTDKVTYKNMLLYNQ